MLNNTVSEGRSVYEVTRKSVVEPDMSQMTIK